MVEKSQRINDFSRWILGVLVGLLCLFLAFKDVNLGELWHALGQIRSGWLLLTITSVLVTFLTKALRWRSLFPITSQPSILHSFRIQAIGMLLNSFLPARLGDIGRAYWMGDSLSIKTSFVLGTVVMEKMFEMFLVVTTLVVAVVQITLPDWVMLPWLRLAVISCGILLIIGLLVWQRKALLQLLDHIGRGSERSWLVWLVDQARAGIEGFEVLRRPGQIIRVMGWSLISWMLAASTNYLVFLAIGLKVSGWAAWLLLVVLQLGVAVPSSPGRIGVFHYLTILVLALFNVSQSIALSCGIILHLVIVGSISAVGVWCLWHEKISWQGLRTRLSKIRV